MGSRIEYFFYTCILVAQVIHVTMSECVYTKTMFSCISADEEEFKYAVREFLSAVDQQVTIYKMEIKLIDSSISSDFRDVKLLEMIQIFNKKRDYSRWSDYIFKLDFSDSLGVGEVEVNDIIINVTNKIFNNYGRLQLYVNFESNRLTELSFLEHMENPPYSIILRNNLFFRLGNIPTQNPNFTRILNFKNCHIYYLDRDVFQNYSTLETLDLSNNNIQHLNFSLQNLRSLHTLYLGDNSIENINKTEFLYADSLQHLDLQGNNIKTFSLLFNHSVVFSSVLLGRNLHLNDVTIESKNSIPTLHNIDFSDCNMNEVNNYTISGFSLKSSLNLKGNNLNTLFPFSFNYKMFSQPVDIYLTNSSIKNLSENAFNGLVIWALNLSYNRIQILQEHTFNNFTSEVLDLSHNQIYSANVLSFSKGFVNKVILSNNMLSALDLSLFCWTNTNEIDLSNNKILQLDISFCNNTNLRLNKLILSNNLISSLPTYLSVNATMFDHLNHLNLSRNRITELHFYRRNFFKSLEIFDASHNYINIISPNDFTNMRRLKTLYLQGNLLSHISPNAFSNILNITSLSLSFDSRNGPWRIGTNQFSKLDKLVNLTITNSNISLGSKNCLYGLISLERVNFENVSIIDLNVQPDMLNGLTSLKEANLSLIFNKRSELFSGIFRGLDNLRNLSITYGTLYWIKYNSFEGLFSLESLNLSYNAIRILEVGAFRGLKRLRNLRLNNNLLQDLGKAGTFYELENLQLLDLSFNNLQFISELLFIPLKSLTELRITNNHIRTLEYSKIIHYSSIYFFYLEDNYWPCDYLEIMLNEFSSHKIFYKPKLYTSNTTNIEGIVCH